MTYTIVPALQPTRITILDGSTPLARWTLQSPDRAGRSLRWIPDGKLAELGSGAGFARLWAHRGFRLELSIKWGAGLMSSRETWTGSSWSDPETLPTAQAHCEILDWAARFPMQVEPWAGDMTALFVAAAFERGPSLEDTRGVVHSDLELVLQGTSFADALTIPATLDPDALTGWSYGPWSYYTWDSARIPGNVTAGGIVYNLKTNRMDLYPGGAYTCEIQRRDLTDRVHHTFQTHAKMSQIIEAGYISKTSVVTAWVHLKGETLYVHCVGPIVNAKGRSPSKTAVFRLDSIDPVTLEGTYTLLSEVLLNTGAGSGTMPSSAYAPGAVGLGAVGYGGFVYLSAWPWNRVVTSSSRHFTDTYLRGVYIDIAEWAKVTVDVFVTPPSPILPSRVLHASEYYSYKIITCSKLPWEEASLEDFTVINEASGNVRSDMGMSWDGFDTGENALSGVNVQGDTSDLYEISATLGGGLDPFHPAGMHLTNAHGILRGRMYDMTRFFYRNSRNERVFWTPPTMPGSDRLAGVWGDSQAIVGIRGTMASNNVNWNYFYVCKSSDTTFSKKYSIYSSVDAYGRILHLEGVEDVTPSMWLDDTKLFDLN